MDKLSKRVCAWLFEDDVQAGTAVARMVRDDPTVIERLQQIAEDLDRLAAPWSVSPGGIAGGALITDH